MATDSGRVFLAEARKLVAASWTQYADARDADGEVTEPWRADAVSWSLLGALVASYERLAFLDGQVVALESLGKACALLAEVVESDTLSEWNDAAGRTQADVLATLDKAGRLTADSGKR